MRRLWITRHKAMAACLAKMKVYIEDPEHGDTTINDTPCRKLGELKNGQQKHFSIGYDGAKVFVVAGKLSRNLYNEFIEIPEGRDDVFLSGKNYLNPAAGNPFRFDGAAGEAALANRKKVSRKGMAILIAAIIVGILGGAAVGVGISGAMLSGTPETVEQKTFTSGDLRLTLTEDFSQGEMAGDAVCYANGDAAVYVLREGFELMEGFGELSLEDYGALVLENNGLSQSVQLRQENGTTVFDYEYTDPGSGNTFCYYTALLKGSDAFWMVQFTAPEENAQEYSGLFRQWAQGVSVLN